jgi:uncharacterized protein (TIGR01777 family)
MKIIVFGGTGTIGRQLILALLKNQHEITVVGRDLKKINAIFNQSVICLSWNQLDQSSASEFDAVINLAGENIAKNRWTINSKKRIKDSRVDSTRKISAWCLKSKDKKPHIYNASAIGIYGLQPVQNNLSSPLIESSEIKLNSSSDFLSEVGHAWENAANTLIANNFPVTFMRFGVVLKRHEGILKKLEIPFLLGLGSIWGNGNQAFSWIHIDDVVNAIIFLLKNPDIRGAVNFCSPHCVSQKTFAKTLANIMHRPLKLKIPLLFIKILFGEMGEQLLLGGQNVYPKRLKELNFQFLYPELQSALAQEWKS